MPASASRERTIYALCEREGLLLDLPPYMLSSQAFKEMLLTFSGQTLEMIRESVVSRLRKPGYDLSGFLPDPKVN